jgi:flavorubredoxin
MPRNICPGVNWVGAVDFSLRLFDALVPTPEGTSYNAYLVQGTAKTALIDTVEPDFLDTLLSHLSQAGITHLDYLVINHAEQDHSGCLPEVLKRFPEAMVVTNDKCKAQLALLFDLAPERVRIIKDRETLDLGGKTLEFIFAPWVHWPETMFTYLREDKILFSCDFLGAHLGTSDLFVNDMREIYEPAKRYYAEIMMPFRSQIKTHLEKLSALPIGVVCPSHGPLHRHPEQILGLYREWVSDQVRNEVVIPFVSMHGSTEKMVHVLTRELISRGITVKPFDLTKTDIGKLAIALVDAATVIFATPTVLMGAHPQAILAAYLTNALKPKTRFVSFMGSFGWAGKTTDQLAKILDQLKAETIPPLIIKGAPRAQDFEAIGKFANEIEARHRVAGLFTGQN